MKVSFMFILILTICYNSRLVSSHELHEPLSCYICMDLDEAAIKQQCDKTRPMEQTCALSSDLINWKHVEEKEANEVTFRCLLLFYKDTANKLQSLRGCVAEYEGYKSCERISEIVKYKKRMSCSLCDTHNCNAGLDVETNSSGFCSNQLSTVLLAIILFLIT